MPNAGAKACWLSPSEGLAGRQCEDGPQTFSTQREDASHGRIQISRVFRSAHGSPGTIQILEEAVQMFSRHGSLVENVSKY